MSEADARWMAVALEEARIGGSRGEVPVGAAVVCGGQLLARNHNRTRELADPTAHAEILALREAAGKIGDWRLEDCALYVTLEPCAMCAGAIVLGRVQRLVFAAADPKAGMCGSLENLVQDARLNHRVATESGIMEDEAAELLRDFFRERRLPMRKMLRVLVADEVRYFAEQIDVPPDVEVTWLSASEPVPEGDFVGLLPLLTRRIDADVLERLPNLKVVANYAVGYDNIDVEALRVRGVAVSNTPDVLTEATAELTWALILAACRRVNEAERLARSGDEWAWHPTFMLGTQLGGRTLGLLGAGRIGQAVGRRALPFGMEVVYWDRVPQLKFEREVGARRIEMLGELLGAADVISIHVQLTSETEGLIGREQIAEMKDGSILVNTARGGIVDEAALCEALESGKLRGAGLDVYENEPEIRDCLKRLRNVVLLPHVGSATEDTRRRMFELAWENLMRGIRGEALVTPVA